MHKDKTNGLFKNRAMIIKMIFSQKTVCKFKLRAMLLLAVLLCGGVSAFAYEETWQNGIQYELQSDLTAKVSDVYDSDTIYIPEKITCNGKDYLVTGIMEDAFINCKYHKYTLIIGSGVRYISSRAFVRVLYGRGTTIYEPHDPKTTIWLGNTPQAGVNSLYNYVSNNSVSVSGKIRVCPSLSSKFETFEKDGIIYMLTNQSDCTCDVIGSKSSTMFANIPERVTYQEKDYKVTGIGFEAFSNKRRLACVVIPSSVTTILDGAFYGCSSLHSVTMGIGVQSIAETAFAFTSEYRYGRTYYTYIRPEKVIWLGNTPPEGYENVKGEYNYVSNDSFTGLSNTKVYPFLSSMFEKNGVKYVPVNPSERTCDAIDYVYDSTKICIPREVTYEGRDYTVKGLGKYAFYGYNGIIYTITIGSEIQSLVNVFNSDVKPKKVIWLGNTPPEGYMLVKGIYNYISNDSFTGLSNAKVYPFLSSMFEKDGIKYVPVNPSEHTCDAIDCSYGSTAANINIGKTVNYKGVELAVKDIRPYTCYGNKYVKSVKVDYDGAIGYGAFYACDSVASVDITATTIGDSAFYESNAVTEAKIMAKIIGASAFENSATKEVAKFEINADTIENNAFKGSKAVTEAKITAKIIGVSAFENGATKEPAKFEIKADKIDNSAFKGNSAITEAKITAKTIGVSAFENSATKNPAKFEINADKIGNYAFDGNSAITEAKITAKTIGASAFENSATKEPAKFEITADTIRDNAFTGCSKMEDAVLGESLKSIGNSAFKDCASLKGIIIPDSVASIGGRCFSGCETLAYAKIGAGVSVIPDEAFNNCKSLPEITIPKTVERIGNNVFPGCFALTDVTIADRETELKLGSNVKSPMFSSCPLKSVYIGGNITYGTSADDGYSPFYRNTSLETVRITDKETEISENEFYGCASLKSVSMGDGIDTIGKYAFSGCSALESFSFGTGLKSIGDEAFSDCTGMKKLVSKTAVPPVCGSQALDDINKWECTLYVPQASLEDYKSAAQWKEFFFLETGIKNVPNTSSSATESERYSTDGTRLASPQKGINIIRMSDGTVKKVLVK